MYSTKVFHLKVVWEKVYHASSCIAQKNTSNKELFTEKLITQTMLLKKAAYVVSSKL